MQSLILTCLLTNLVAPQDGTKAKVPDVSAQKESEKLIRDLFKAEYSKSAPSDRTALARKLFQQGKDTKDDSTSRFVLFREARDLATQAGDALLAFEIIDVIAQVYEVDVAELRAGALAVATKVARNADEMRSIASAYLKLANDASATDDYEAAEKAVNSASNLARKAKDVAFVSRLEARAKEISEEKTRFVAVRKAKETLAANPADAGANMTVGRFYCIVKGQWGTGLPFLSQGTASPLKELALRELANPTEARDQLLLGDGWWDAGEKESGKAREHLRAQAARWYEAAMPNAAGLAKVKAERRLEEMRRSEASAKRVDLLKMIDPAKDSAAGRWFLKGNLLVKADKGTCMIPYIPPDEYDLRLVVERTEGIVNLMVGIVTSGRTSGISIDGGDTGDHCGLSYLDDKPSMDNETNVRGRFLALGKPAVAVCSVRKTGVALTIDGKKIFDWKGDLNRLSLNPGTHVTRTDTLYLSGMGLFQFSEISLFPLSGEGKRVR